MRSPHSTSFTLGLQTGRLESRGNLKGLVLGALVTAAGSILANPGLVAGGTQMMATALDPNIETPTGDSGMGGMAASLQVHLNSRESLSPNHRYEIVENATGDVAKTGVSGQELNANGSSPRANRQVNALNRAEGGNAYSSRIVETNMPGRAAALQAEQAATTQLAQQGNSLRLQVRPRP